MVRRKRWGLKRNLSPFRWGMCRNSIGPGSAELKWSAPASPHAPPASDAALRASSFFHRLRDEQSLVYWSTRGGFCQYRGLGPEGSWTSGGFCRFGGWIMNRGGAMSIRSSESGDESPRSKRAIDGRSWPARCGGCEGGGVRLRHCFTGRQGRGPIRAIGRQGRQPRG